MHELLAELDAFINEGQEAAAGSGSEKPGSEPPAGNVQVKDGGEVAAKSAAAVKPDKDESPAGLPAIKKLPTPGHIGGVLAIILLIVFAIMPAYPGAQMSRLQILWMVISGGGGMRGDDAAGSASPMDGNGVDNAYKSPADGLWHSGSSASHAYGFMPN